MASMNNNSWKKIVARYTKPDIPRALWQLTNTLVPFIGLWVLMILSLKVSYWLALPLCALAGGFLMRMFIIFHDCGHGSFFASRRANDILGFIAGVLLFTPYHYWTHRHAIHHATAGNLDKRGFGDVWTMTVREYRGSSRWQRIKFRLYRSPFILFILGPIYLFLIHHRFAARGSGARWHLSVLWTNLAILGVMIAMSALIGWKAYLILQLPVILTAAASGVWMFYMQHQFDGVWWERDEKWDFLESALRGSSFYKLPKILQWFSGSIGFHHIHHLSPRIPNYFLERCHRENPLFQRVKAMTFISSLKSIGLRAWDEDAGKLVGLGVFFL